MKDWIAPHESDPRLPTDPEFVEVNALAQNYSATRGALIEFAIRYPRTARKSGGNPWTKSDLKEALFLHEPSVAAHFSRLSGPK
ncbi:MAG: hypothetical protein WC314_01890 [Vulcanimicrobiota bacterium]